MSQRAIECSCPSCGVNVEVPVEREPLADAGGVERAELTGNTAECRDCGLAFDLLYYDTEGLTGEKTRPIFE